MATELRLTRTLRGFEPSDDDSREAMKAIKLGASVKCEVRIARDNSRMRYFWGLVGVIVDNTDDEIFGGSKDACADSIKLAIGHVDQVQVYNGKEWHITRMPRSISFSKLTEPEFQDFIKRAEAYACSVLCVTDDQLADALTEYIAPGFKREGQTSPPSKQKERV